MYEEIKDSLKWVNKKALIAVGMIAVIFMIMGVFFFSLISLVLGIILICIIFKTLSYPKNSYKYCKQIENYLNMPSEKKERFSVSCINAYPKYLGKPSTSYKKLMKSLILKNSIFILDFVIGAAFLIFGLLMAKITGIVIISFFAAPFFLHCIITLLTERKNVRNNYYAFLSKFRMYDNRQFEEMIASSVRISKFGYINDDYFFMADKLYGIKLSDIRNVSESAFVNNGRHLSSITFFLSGSSVRIDFQNEKERDFVINVMRKVMKYRFDK